MEIRTGPCLCGEPEKVIEENGRKILVRCPLFKYLDGVHPKTGEKVDGWDCAISWLMTLIMENTREAIGVSASIDSFRNKMVRQQEAVLKMAENGQLEEIVDSRDADKGAGATPIKGT